MHYPYAQFDSYMNGVHRHASYLDVMRQIVEGASKMSPRTRLMAAREAAAHHDEPCEHCWLNARQTEAHALDEAENLFLTIPESWSDEFSELRAAVEAKAILADNNEYDDSRFFSWGDHDDIELMNHKMAETAVFFGLPTYNPNLTARYQDPDR